MDEPEKGIKWWLRYVIVPILGTGGIIAVVVAVLSRPPSTNPLTLEKLRKVLISGLHLGKLKSVDMATL